MYSNAATGPIIRFFPSASFVSKRSRAYYVFLFEVFVKVSGFSVDVKRNLKPIVACCSGVVQCIGLIFEA